MGAKVVKDYLTTAEALEKAKGRGIELSLPTLIKLCRERGLGKQIAGPRTKWLVYANKLDSFLNQGDY